MRTDMNQLLTGMVFRITHTVILEDPYEDLPGMIVPDASPDINTVDISVS